MAVNLKHIAAVPTAKDFIDIVLSRTQRQTPTVVHRGVRAATRPPLPRAVPNTRLLTPAHTLASHSMPFRVSGPSTCARRVHTTPQPPPAATGTHCAPPLRFARTPAARRVVARACVSLTLLFPTAPAVLLQVKFTQQVWHEKLAKILEEFPRVDDVHPFYADLMNVLYDKVRSRARAPAWGKASVCCGC
jgi:hypothetical protein